MKLVIPALLEKSEPVLMEKIQKLKTFARRIQIDIADNTLVRNKTISLKSISQLPKGMKVEVHLMVRNPAEFLGQCLRLRADLVICHIEAFPELEGLHEFIAKAKKLKLRIGIAINPETSSRFVEPYLHFIDSVMFMAIHPGFQNQKFIYSTIKKVRKFRKSHPKAFIEVDGGIKKGIAKKVAKAGANGVVIGSAITQHDMQNALKEFKEEIQSA